MTSSGLGATDFGNKGVVGGLARDFYRALGSHYGVDEAWTFEPHVAERVYKDLVASHRVEVLFEHRVIAANKSNSRITQIILEHAPTDHYNAHVASPASTAQITIAAKVFIDASYEGDLMARAGVSFAVGREAASLYQETFNGICARTPKHQFVVPVDPFVRRNDPGSGLLPFIQQGDGGIPGSADHRVQAYNFRLCLTQREDIHIPLTAPPNYNEHQYELLSRYIEAAAAGGHPVRLHRLFMAISRMPNGKTDVNNSGGFSTDYIGMNWGYPNADYTARGHIWRDHIHYTKGFLYHLATSPRVPKALRDEMGSWGLCRDEFTDTQHWPHQLYVREARRMIGSYVVTQADCEHATSPEDVIGMAAYTMDSHNCQRVVQNDVARNEGNVEVKPRGPYPIGYGAILPRAAECQNLLVPVCLSASHIAYGSIRMEPVFMVLGQSAAIAAAQSVEENCSVQEIDRDALATRLLDADQVLEYEPTGDAVSSGNP